MIAELKYLVVYAKSFWPDHPIETIIPDCACTDLDFAYGMAEVIEQEIIEMSVHVLNPSDYWRGWFYFNDDSDDEPCPLECNSREHLDAHWETNNSGGHYDCNKYEHIVNGNIIETINHNEQESECN